jgi:hypothetical protein
MVVRRQARLFGLAPLLLVAQVVACSGTKVRGGAPKADDPVAPAEGASAVPPALDGGAPDASTPDNAIDAVVLPMLAQAGLPYVAEDPFVLVRRMSVDLTGIVASAADQAACAGKSPRAIATYFMNKPSAPHVPDGSPPYVFVNRRWWADKFQYDVMVPEIDTNGSTFYLYAQALDQAVGDLYAGNIRYDQFARKALGSPAFARRFGVFKSNHDLVQIASQAYQVFLGRAALPEEAEDFGNLWRAWGTREMTPMDSNATYGAACPADPPAAPGVACAHTELGLDGAACAGANLSACRSTVLGAGQVVPATAGFVAFRALAPADLAALDTPGNLMVASREFAAAAVTSALVKYLGWWDADVVRPRSEVPAARDALAKKFVAGGFDVRAMELEIVTSALYTARATLAKGQNPNDPVWAFGPTKLLYAEAWLDSIGAALGTALGTCDFRYPTPIAPFVPGAFVSPASSPIRYDQIAAQLGGCPLKSAHADPSGLVPMMTKRKVLAALCPGAFTPKPNATLADVVARVSAGFGRPLTAEETGAILARMRVPENGGCAPDAPSAACLSSAAAALCTSLYATAAFNEY